MKARHLTYLTCLVGALICAQAQAQDYEQLKKESQARFDAQRKEADQRYESFRQQANAAYEQKLRAPWTRQEGMDPIPVPFERQTPPPAPEPQDTPPVTVPAPVVVAPAPEPSPEPKPVVTVPQPVTPEPVTPVVPVEPVKPVAPVTPEPVKPVTPTPSPEPKNGLQFAFWGAAISVDVPSAMPSLGKNHTKDAIADMWEKLCDTKYDPLLVELLEIKTQRKLSDWLYMSLVMQASSKIYPSDDASAKVLANYVLVESGFDVRPAMETSGTLHLLVHTDCCIYGKGFWTLDGKDYYLLDDSKVNSLNIPDVTFQDSQAARMAMRTAPCLGSRKASGRVLKSKYGQTMTVSLEVNEDYVEMLGNYPMIYNDNDTDSRWMYYAMTRLDDETKQSLYNQIKAQISGKSKVEAASMILNWVQTAFIYGFDDEIWGEDRPFHSEETLYYPYCDCEDRSILFSRLVRDLLGLDVVLVHYPGHLATAVYFPGEQISGAGFLVDGKRYVVCDPTFVDGAPIGTQGRDLDLSKTVIVRL